MTNEEAIKHGEEQLQIFGGTHREFILTAIKALKKRPQGKWVNNIHDLPICNKCGYMTPYDRAIDDYEYGNFCPNCGADMRGEENE